MCSLVCWRRPVYACLCDQPWEVPGMGESLPVLRVFLAVSPPQALRPAFEEVRMGFHQHGAVSWRWVLPEHIHLTLKFLGEIPRVSLTPVIEQVEQAVAGQRPFSVQAQALGCFPHSSRPRLLWMGLSDPEGALAYLQQHIETALQHLGFPPEQRSFHPHLTLARISQVPREQPLATLLHIYGERFFGEFPVTHVQVLQSQLGRQGAVYTVLQTILLQNSNASFL